MLLATGEFTSLMIPDKDQRHIVEQNWVSLRSILLSDLQKEWPALVYATQQTKIADIEERVQKAKIKHESNEFEESIRNAGVSCEGMLQILYSIYGLKELDKPEYSDLLCSLREVIIEQFGDLIYEDLDFIREWRNAVVHPSSMKPNELDSLQVVRKTELFHEMFKKQILTKKRQ